MDWIYKYSLYDCIPSFIGGVVATLDLYVNVYGHKLVYFIIQEYRGFFSQNIEYRVEYETCEMVIKYRVFFFTKLKSIELNMRRVTW